MTHPIRLCLVLHNHQPIGNFDAVFEQAYQDSYLPFLDVFEPFGDLRLSLHVSGPLFEWLDEHHSDYVDRLAKLASTGRIEIIGGAWYEPILTMIPPRDRVGQIQNYTQVLESRLGTTIQGMWIPERVWEQSLTSDIADAGIKYTVLDDFHFRNAGLTADQLHGYYLTEDNGRLLSVFPGSERLRYTIPFGAPRETIDYLRGIADRFSNAVVVFGDDGEKFGTWPDTKEHVYNDGWLQSFFAELSANHDWLLATTLAEASVGATPWGKIYLPDASYREMTEWALPVEQQLKHERIVHEMNHDERWPRIAEFLRGGFWRNFKVKYPEANEMYARMMMVSQRLNDIRQSDIRQSDIRQSDIRQSDIRQSDIRQSDSRQSGADVCVNHEELEWACQALYRAQCNCSYWHGAFGGIYLPHLRNAVYNQMIAADNLLDRATGRTDPWVEATVDDFNFDARQEVCLANDKLACLLAPAAGGQMYELDVRSICHNLLATLARRPEAYHQKVRAGANQSNGNVTSIHDSVKFKQEGLSERLQYDQHERKSLLDRFYDLDTGLEAVRMGTAAERGDFIGSPYETRIRRKPDRVQVQFIRQGSVGEIPVKITKGVTAESGRSVLEIAYLLEGLPSDQSLHFGIEFNFAGLPSGASDRFFHHGDAPGNQERLGPFETTLDLKDSMNLCLMDQWLGIDVRLGADQPTSWWTFPIETVSLSEGGFELVHQSVVVQPHWLIRGDSKGRWSVTMQLEMDTRLAEERMHDSVATAVL